MKREQITLWTVCMAVLLVQMDTSIVNLAVKPIGEALGGGIRALQWVLDAYNLTYAGLLLPAAALSDRFGVWRIFLLGGALLLVSSFMCGIAPNLAVLIGGRVLTGISAALLMPASLAMLAATFPQAQQRAHALGIWASCNGLAFIVGPTLGGWILTLGGWRWLFFPAVPLALLMVSATLYFIPPAPRPPRLTATPWRGQILFLIVLTTFTLLAIDGRHWGITNGRSLFTATTMLIAVGALIHHERHCPMPLIPRVLVRQRAFNTALLITAFMTFGMYALLFLLPLYLLKVLQLTTLHSGLLLLPLTIPFVVVSRFSGKLTMRWGQWRMMVIGMGIMSFGVAVLALSTSTERLALIVPILMLIGVGLGLNNAPVIAAVLHCAPPAHTATASGLSNSARMIGATLGVAIIGGVYARAGFEIAYAVAALVLALGAILANPFTQDNNP